MRNDNYIGIHGLTPKWRGRFTFFKIYGSPGGKCFRRNLAELSVAERLLVQFNFIAFFFGPIYWVFLGLWKKNVFMIGLIACSVILKYLMLVLDVYFVVVMSVAIDLICMIGFATTTNYAYYLKQVYGQQGWNPFEGYF